ncbi:hypothetical protein [uncultured Thiodictyon sp.]|uniref:hypothetical protein n=1 Tax=uncultured Thiodictyon sp. TaxID=1846217 RepID=UPI0025FC2A2E|nr:hypothetical protein [uncultured Thiodictyon sp.]
MTKWHPYPDGLVLPEAGLRVLERVCDGPDQLTTRYRVRLLCCNCILEMAHKTIRYRKKDRTQQCRSCFKDRCQEASEQGNAANDLPAYHQLSQQFIPGWGLPLLWDPAQVVTKRSSSRPRY